VPVCSRQTGGGDCSGVVLHGCTTFLTIKCVSINAAAGFVKLQCNLPTLISVRYAALCWPYHAHQMMPLMHAQRPTPKQTSPDTLPEKCMHIDQENAFVC